MRTDMEVREQIYLLSVLSIGMLTADAWLPDEFKLTDEEAADLVAETIKRTLELPSPTKEALATVSHEFNKYMKYVLDLVKDKNAEEIEE